MSSTDRDDSDDSDGSPSSPLRLAPDRKAKQSKQLQLPANSSKEKSHPVSSTMKPPTKRKADDVLISSAANKKNTSD